MTAKQLNNLRSTYARKERNKAIVADIIGGLLLAALVILFIFTTCR